MCSKRKVKRVASLIHPHGLLKSSCGQRLQEQICGTELGRAAVLLMPLLDFKGVTSSVSFSTFCNSDRKPLYTGCRPSDHKGCRHPEEVLGGEDMPGACREGSRAMGITRPEQDGWDAVASQQPAAWSCRKPQVAAVGPV